ncbi:MAG: pilus assembly protein PilM [Eubacteriales bacterium]|nr:pilus assembly protein PilM [Eubacteriales bacterium]
MKKNYIGIQFDSNGICMAQFSGKNLRRYYERMPENLVQGEDITSPEMFASLLRETKKKGGFSGSSVALTLPLRAAYFRTLALPAMNDAQLRLNIPYEFKDYIGTESFRYNFDYAVTSVDYDEEGKPEMLHLLAGAASKSLLDEYAGILKRAGLTLKAAIPMEMSIINVAEYAAKNGVHLATEECICHIGMNVTILSIVNEGRLSAFKVVDIGCAQIDDAISAIYGIDPYVAASYRDVNHENVLSSDRCLQVYDSIALEVMKTINFYRFENPNTTLQHVTITGLGAGIQPLEDDILSYIKFEKRDVAEWLGNQDVDDFTIEKCALAVGAAIDNE